MRVERCVPENENASTMIIAFRLNVGVGHQEHGENDSDDIPAREDKATRRQSDIQRRSRVKHT